MRSRISRFDSDDPSPPVMDVGAALSRLGGDEELLAAIVQIYLEDSPALLQRIERAVAQGEAKSLQLAAHSLKGLAVTLSAADVAAEAGRLEYMGSSGNMAEAAAGLSELEQAADALTLEAKGRLKGGLRAEAPHRLNPHATESR